MAIVNFVSGSTNNRTQAEAADTNNTFNGVAGGPVETLNIQLDSNGVLLLAGQTARFNNLAVKVIGSTGNDTYTGTENAETISGLAGNDNLSGNGGNDILDGGAGNDTLDGGVGDDKMTGGAGNDTFVVDSTADALTEAANGGTDTVLSSIDFILKTNFENLVLTGSDDLNGTGNTAANRITGNEGNNLLKGLAGNDVLIGGDGDDTLDGGVGNDIMIGGDGDDTYIVNSASDKISELSDDGTDTVESSVSYKLGSNLENLTLTGAAVINGTGNALDNEITGNAKANILTGGAGDDTLDGGAGNDSLVGGTGDDTYVVDSVGDKVTELTGEGIDTVVTGLSYALGDNLENLTLTGENDVDGDGNELDNVIIGNEGNNVLDGGDGDDELSGGDGDDILLGGDGDDTLDGGDGDDILIGGDGDNTFIVSEGDDLLIAGKGIDTVVSEISFTLGDDFENLTLTGEDDIDGTGNDEDNVITGNEGNNVLDGGDGDDLIDGGEGDDTFLISEGEDVLIGGEGSDTFVFDTSEIDDTEIDGGVDDEDVGDQEVNIVDFKTPHASNTISTVASTLGTAHAIDIIQFNQSGDFTNLEFSNIEQVHLASGVSITLSADAVSEAFESLEVDGVNPGVHFYGVAGGATETVTVAADYEDTVFTPAGTVVGGTPTTYSRADFQLDDASIGDLFHNVTLVHDFQTGSSATAHGLATYAREDGSNSSETILGNEGVDNADGRLGDDIIYGNGGNDLLKGEGGADTIDGGDGNDFFVINGFETGIIGAYGKADDGNAEWIATGAKHDVIIGGSGVDTLRITVGSDTVAHGTIVLNDDNFQGMERVEVGSVVGRLNVENSADMQLIKDHYYLNAGQTVAVPGAAEVFVGGSVLKNLNLIKVDASGITDTDADATTGGLTFEGNGNVNTFIGTQNNDIFIGNGGNDVLTGSGGSDTFQFGKVHTMTPTDADGAGPNTVQVYQDVASSLSGSDTITDFMSGIDHFALDQLQYTSLNGITDFTNHFVQGAGAVAGDADDFLVFDTTSHTLYYDADGSGAGAAISLATLTGVTSLAAGDFGIF